MPKVTFSMLVCFLGVCLTPAVAQGGHDEEQEWHELPVNKLTKMLKLVKDVEKKEESRQEKWARATKQNFFKKELRKVSKMLDTHVYEIRLLEGSTIHLECIEREMEVDEDRQTPSKFAWMRNGVFLEEETTDVSRIRFDKEQQMTISPAGVGDSGRYACYYDDELVGQVSLEVLSIVDAILEGILIMVIMVGCTVPIYAILMTSNRSKVRPIEEILQEKEEEDVGMDDRVDEILAVLEKANPRIKGKRRLEVLQEDEQPSDGLSQGTDSKGNAAPPIMPRF
uniref:Ig-like domain-containing protein n=1 Tax=Trichuris muris TaxID=70415 RepID=A0A5S6QYI9_TRIMR